MEFTSTEQLSLGHITRSKITELLAATTLSSGTSSVTSSTFVAGGYRTALAYLRVNDTGSTAANNSVQFTPQFSSDSGATYYSFLEGVWASMTFSAVQLQTSTFYRAHNIPLNGRRMRFQVERDTTATPADFSVAVSIEAID